MGIQFTNQPVHEKNCRLNLNRVISTKTFVCIYQSTFALRNYKTKTETTQLTLRLAVCVDWLTFGLFNVLS